ncbi:hypothetical protein [Bradyrhizobium sp. DASA03120]|uniref:hypothetical protein n=1 Tax=Bradyrhizobium sp. SMVTL-02 TaxID=3395917 RepID=UPI003F72E6C4
MLQVLHLRGLEIIEQLPRLAGVIALTNHEPYPSLLLKDVALALSYVPLGFFQMSELHRAVHATAYHKEDDLGARKILLFSFFLGIMSRRVASQEGTRRWMFFPNTALGAFNQLLVDRKINSIDRFSLLLRQHIASNDRSIGHADDEVIVPIATGRRRKAGDEDQFLKLLRGRDGSNSTKLNVSIIGLLPGG